MYSCLNISMVVCLLCGTVEGGNFLFCGSIFNDVMILDCLITVGLCYGKSTMLSLETVILYGRGIGLRLEAASLCGRSVRLRLMMIVFLVRGLKPCLFKVTVLASMTLFKCFK